MRLKKIAVSLLIGMSVFCSGCVSGPYYRVTDPTSGKIYYTDGMNFQQSGYSGAVMLRDAITGDTVTIQNSEISRIPEGEFKAAVGR